MTNKQRSKIKDPNTNTDTSLGVEVMQQSMVFLNNNGIVATDRLTMLTQNPHKSTHIHSSMTLKVHYVYPHNFNKTANQPPTHSPRLKDTLPHLTHPHTWETRQRALGVDTNLRWLSLWNPTYCVWEQAGTNSTLRASLLNSRFADCSCSRCH